MQTHRRTGAQAHRRTDAQTHRHTESHRGKEPQRHRGTETQRHRRHTHAHTHAQTLIRHACARTGASSERPCAEADAATTDAAPAACAHACQRMVLHVSIVRAEEEGQGKRTEEGRQRKKLVGVDETK
eukprot:3937557-Rhodomonas_salina.2